MALRRVTLAAAAAAALTASQPLWAAPAEPPKDPSFLHGAGQVLGGIVFELPKTVLDATMTGPPVVGTAVGLLAGAARAAQVVAAGLVEMSQGFGLSEKQRRR